MPGKVLPSPLDIGSLSLPGYLVPVCSGNQSIYGMDAYIRFQEARIYDRDRLREMQSGLKVPWSHQQAGRARKGLKQEAEGLGGCRELRGSLWWRVQDGGQACRIPPKAWGSDSPAPEALC